MKVISTIGSGSGALLKSLLAYVDAPTSVLYWGVNPPLDPPHTVIHCGKFIDGMQQLQAMATAKIGVPAFTSDLQEAIQWQQSEGTNVWGRMTTHTQGRDIRRYGHKEWAEREFWVKQIPSSAIVNEWRLHVFNGLSIARGKKTQVELLARKLAPLVRSRRNGWRLAHADEPPQGAKFYAKAAVGACGYLWGAVDMLEVDLTKMPANTIVNQEKLQKSLDKSLLTPFVVLEVNQKPGMDDYTAGKYAEAVKKYHLKTSKTANPAAL